MIEPPLSILIVEDSVALAANIYDFLEACGHAPDAAPWRTMSTAGFQRRM